MALPIAVPPGRAVSVVCLFGRFFGRPNAPNCARLADTGGRSPPSRGAPGGRQPPPGKADLMRADKKFAALAEGPSVSSGLSLPEKPIAARRPRVQTRRGHREVTSPVGRTPCPRHDLHPPQSRAPAPPTLAKKAPGRGSSGKRSRLRVCGEAANTVWCNIHFLRPGGAGFFSP